MHGSNSTALNAQLCRQLGAGHHSRALGALTTEFERRLKLKGSSLSILDLGQSFESNISFYSKFSRKIHFEDIASDSFAQSTTHPEGERSPIEVLSWNSQKQFDLIVCWDILNYLTKEEILSVGEALRNCVHEDSVVLAYFWKQPQIPHAPLKFRIGENHQMGYSLSDQQSRPCTPLRKTDFEKLLPQFLRWKSLLLRSGLEECLLKVKPVAQVVEQQAAS